MTCLWGVGSVDTSRETTSGELRGEVGREGGVGGVEGGRGRPWRREVEGERYR